MKKSVTVDDYINQFPKHVQGILQKIRSVVKYHASDAIESISYGMPAYKLNGKPLIYFAGYLNHIGFYATPTGHDAFKTDLSAYKQGKGSVQFPLDKEVPYDLIEKIVIFRVNEVKDKS